MASQISQLQSYLSSRFVAGKNTDLTKDTGFQQYVKAQPVNPGSIKDVRTLNAALRTKQINQNQWNQQFKTIQSGTNGPSINTSLKGNINPFTKGAAIRSPLGTALNMALHSTAAVGKPIVDVATGQGGRAAHDTAQLGRDVGVQQLGGDVRSNVASTVKHVFAPTGSQAQRDALIKNQTAAEEKLNPQFNTKGTGNTGIVDRVKNDVVSAYQHANPFSGVHDANKLISQTEKQYGLTPNFVKTLHNANTSLSNKPLDASNSDSRKGTTSIGISGLPGANNVELSKGNKTAASTLVHEGLHQVWNNNPKLQQQFIDSYNKDASPELRTFLVSQLKGYKDFSKAPKDALMNLNKLPKNLQDEVHSMTAEYYLKNKGVAPKNNLSNYYSQFLNLGKTGNGTKTNQPTTQDLLKQGVSVNAVKTAQSMIAKGTDPAKVQQYVQNEVAKKKAADIQMAGDAAAITSFNVGSGLTVRTLGAALTKAGAKAAVGKDAAVNTLIDSQRAAAALKTGAKANRAADLGSATIKEANTTRIPVVSPTETAGARTSLGSTAVDNANRTTIPVKGTSTEVAGKVTQPSATYVKQSNQLSKAYEKESAGLQNLPSPRAQQVLQDRIDTKYAKLQQQLDETHGQTNVSFTGKAKPVVGNSTIPQPVSAFDKEVKTPYNPTAVSGGAGKATAVESKTIPVQTAKTAPTASTDVKTVSTPNTGSPTGATKVAGSSLRTQQEAIQAGMKSEAENTGATFTGVSHKEEAAKAAKLVNEDPNKAMDIAMGRARGDNISHDSAVYHAVKNAEIAKATKTGDWGTVTDLVNSQRHTAVSEAAQRLGAEGHNLDPHDPVNILHDIAKTRAKTGSKRLTKQVDEASKVVQANTKKVSRQDWHSFIQELQCK